MEASSSHEVILSEASSSSERQLSITMALIEKSPRHGRDDGVVAGSPLLRRSRDGGESLRGHDRLGVVATEGGRCQALERGENTREREEREESGGGGVVVEEWRDHWERRDQR
ncbi:uncharacterized protein A4U43_C09F11980 [Asparagus officinalis]|uniref:Uncharacterized protein n=1 Tax=Asparagus officinalis TaxID=4686 RepID=A0A5P1E7F4_ASPOF|nr:uncharacterized protein A4U43_C09F11980 [Asparagus officinalis]